MKDFLTILGGISLVVGMALLRGWTLSVLWGWFITPALGLPVPAMPLVIGLALIVSYLTNSNTDVKEKYKNSQTARTVQAIQLPFLVLLIGWIITWFM